MTTNKKKIKHDLECAWLRDDGSKCDCGYHLNSRKKFVIKGKYSSTKVTQWESKDGIGQMIERK